MAKKGGKSSGYQSKGLVNNVNKKTKNLIRREYMASDKRMYNQMEAFIKGKNVVLTIANPDSKQTNKPYIKVNAKELWGKVEG